MAAHRPQARFPRGLPSGGGSRASAVLPAVTSVLPLHDAPSWATAKPARVGPRGDVPGQQSSCHNGLQPGASPGRVASWPPRLPRGRDSWARGDGQAWASLDVGSPAVIWWVFSETGPLPPSVLIPVHSSLASGHRNAQQMFAGRRSEWINCQRLRISEENRRGQMQAAGPADGGGAPCSPGAAGAGARTRAGIWLLMAPWCCRTPGKRERGAEELPTSESTAFYVEAEDGARCAEDAG